ncbi:MAG: SDR family oxidoreductase [Burkholderiaceae bacterium]
MSNKILVTGATGNVGSALINTLRKSARAADVVAAVHAGGRAVDGVASRTVDFADARSLQNAMDGVGTLFLLLPLAETMVSWTKNAVDAAKKAGVKHIVRLSGVGAEPNSPYLILRTHGEADDYVKASGIPYTILQPVSFMQNFVNYNSHSIKQDGAFYQAQADGKVSFIDVRDIGDVAAAIVQNPTANRGKTYTLTGPQALSNEEVAARITDAIGTPVKYINVAPEAAIQAMQNMGMPQWNVDALASLNELIRKGHSSQVTSDVSAVVGRSARNFDAFAKEHASAWKKQ